ncbi:MAG: ferrochelatase [Planctomycetota bacterium]|nr:ferrochelatase [Planctomycetota bacterium]
MMSSTRSQGLLLVNLGSPDDPTVPAVRRYLDQFLMDERVIDIHPLLRNLLVRGIILNTRPKKTAAAYRKVWSEEGSPLIVTSKKLTEEVRALWQGPVALGMRYGNPSIASALDELGQAGADEVIVVPLYPHYSMSSYETAVAKVLEDLSRMADPIQVHFLQPFYDHPIYRKVIAEVTAPYLEGQWDHLLFSFHGLPVRHIEKRDVSGCYCLKTDDCCFTDHPATPMCYRAQCRRTARYLAEDLGLAADQWSVAFQSRLGNDPWLEPATEPTIERLAREGIKNLKIICPAFVADCLETVEEIDMAAREVFMKAGGKQFETIPCLNADPRWAQAIVEMAPEALQRRAAAGADGVISQ